MVESWESDKDDWLSPISNNGEEPFARHNERMKMFRRSHPILIVIALTSERLRMLQFSRPLHVTGVNGATGGLRRQLSEEVWLALVPIKQVDLPGGLQN